MCFAEGRIAVSFKKDALTRGQTVRLGDIALIKGMEDGKLLARLENIEITDSPRADRKKRITATEVMRSIEKELPAIFKSVKWVGKPSTMMSLVTKPFSIQKVIDLAEKELNKIIEKYVADAVDVESSIVPTGVYKDLKLPDGVVDLTTRLTNENILHRRMCIWVDVAVDGRHYQSLPIWFSVSVKYPVLVANENVETDVELDEVKFKLVKKDIARLHGRAVGDIGSLKGKRLLRGIRGGQVVTYENLGKMPDVMTGSKVKVLASVGAISLETVAIALEDGFVGDSIKVKNPSNDEKYMARIIKRSLVSVGEGH